MHAQWMSRTITDVTITIEGDLLLGNTTAATTTSNVNVDSLLAMNTTTNDDYPVQQSSNVELSDEIIGMQRLFEYFSLYGFPDLIEPVVDCHTPSNTTMSHMEAFIDPNLYQALVMDPAFLSLMKPSTNRSSSSSSSSSSSAFNVPESSHLTVSTATMATSTSINTSTTDVTTATAVKPTHSVFAIMSDMSVAVRPQSMSAGTPLLERDCFELIIRNLAQYYKFKSSVFEYILHVDTTGHIIIPDETSITSKSSTDPTTIVSLSATNNFTSPTKFDSTAQLVGALSATAVETNRGLHTWQKMLYNVVFQYFSTKVCNSTMLCLCHIVYYIINFAY